MMSYSLALDYAPVYSILLTVLLRVRVRVRLTYTKSPSIPSVQVHSMSAYKPHLTNTFSLITQMK